MKHARDDYNRIQDPAGLIPLDEPVFLLRANDVAAPETVMHWAYLAQRRGASTEIVELAMKQADAMRSWQAQHGGGKVPDLPAKVPYMPAANPYPNGNTGFGGDE